MTKPLTRLKFVCLADIGEPPPPPMRVGCAEFIPDNLTIKVHLEENNYRNHYEVDMERDDLEDWLKHIMHKRWATSEMLGDLVQVWLYHKDKIPVKRAISVKIKE